MSILSSQHFTFGFEVTELSTGAQRSNDQIESWFFLFAGTRVQHVLIAFFIQWAYAGCDDVSGADTWLQENVRTQVDHVADKGSKITLCAQNFEIHLYLGTRVLLQAHNAFKNSLHFLAQGVRLSLQSFCIGWSVIVDSNLQYSIVAIWTAGIVCKTNEAIIC